MFPKISRTKVRISVTMSPNVYMIARLRVKKYERVSSVSAIVLSPYISANNPFDAAHKVDTAATESTVPVTAFSASLSVFDKKSERNWGIPFISSDRAN